MADMERTELTNVAHARYAANGYKYIELLGVMGPELEVAPDEFIRVFELKAHKVKPESVHYVLEINDPEIIEMVTGSSTMKYYIR